MVKAPRRGLRLAELQLLLLLFLCFLLPDVIADDLFGQTDRADAVPARPEVVTREVALPAEILSVDPDSCAPGFPWTLDCEQLFWQVDDDEVGRLVGGEMCV